MSSGVGMFLFPERLSLRSQLPKSRLHSMAEVLGEAEEQATARVHIHSAQDGFLQVMVHQHLKSYFDGLQAEHTFFFAEHTFLGPAEQWHIGN